MNHFDVRKAQPGDEKAIADVQIRAWKETYRSILPAPLATPWENNDLERIWRDRIARTQNSSTTIVVADAVADSDDTVVGFGICGKGRDRVLPATAEIPLLYILRQFHGHGLGRRLMRSLASHACESGHSTTGLWVLSANEQAVRFYRALGGIQAVERHGRFGGHVTHELGFIWPSALLARSGSLKGAEID